MGRRKGAKQKSLGKKKGRGKKKDGSMKTELWPGHQAEIGRGLYAVGGKIIGTMPTSAGLFIMRVEPHEEQTGEERYIEMPIFCAGVRIGWLSYQGEDSTWWATMCPVQCQSGTTFGPGKSAEEALRAAVLFWCDGNAKERSKRSGMGARRKH